jgi:general nucleoside transport system permease protein
VDRIFIVVLSAITGLCLWLAPWAAINRETGARSALLLLPNRVIDFTGRTDPLLISSLGFVLAVIAVCIVVLLLASMLAKNARLLLWLVAGVALMVVTYIGSSTVLKVVNEARVNLFVESLQQDIDSPRDGTNIEKLKTIIEQAPQRSIEISTLEAKDAGANTKRLSRLPYGNSGIGLTAFLCYITGILAIVLGLRRFDLFDDTIDRVLGTIAVPLTSILLALLVSGIVILSLQGTPVAEGLTFTPLSYITGRLDTLWYSYLTLFANSLGTVEGFVRSLAFATPLIFTGLAVAVGFQAGLFNIGGPGQMILGAIFSMLVGVYMPGPRVLVLPAAILAAALGGGLWGALPGWLKARFGANEVINTILLNYIASSLLLFLLSSESKFAAPAVRIIYVLAAAAGVAILLSLIPAIRHRVIKAPRVYAAIFAVLILVAAFVAGLPQAGDKTISLKMPFKQPGSEPKSFELREEAWLPKLPTLLGVPAGTAGTVIVPVNYGLIIAPILGILAFIFLPRLIKLLRRLGARLIAALAVAALAYAASVLFGLNHLATRIPPTNLNMSFVIAIAAAIFVYYFLWRTKWGYELRAVGLSPLAAEYGGANIARNTILAMTLSGALAGLTACHYVLGGALEDYSLRQALPSTDGFDGIAVALLGYNTPIGVVLSAFLFGVLKNGGVILNLTFSDLNRYVVSMVLALVVLFIAAKGFLPETLTNPLKRMAAQAQKKRP